MAPGVYVNPAGLAGDFCRAVLALPEGTLRSSGPLAPGPTPAVGGCVLALPSSRHAPASPTLPAALEGLGGCAARCKGTLTLVTGHIGAGAQIRVGVAQAFPPGDRGLQPGDVPGGSAVQRGGEGQPGEGPNWRWRPLVYRVPGFSEAGGEEAVRGSPSQPFRTGPLGRGSDEMLGWWENTAPRVCKG